PPPPPPPPPPAPRADVVGRWEGFYRCQRDQIGFSLNILNNEGNQINAVFEFFPLAGGTSFPRGSFQMSGEYDRTDGSIRLRNTGWIKRPMGFQPHDLEGQLVRNGAEIAGRILTTGCADFVLARR